MLDKLACPTAFEDVVELAWYRLQSCPPLGLPSSALALKTQSRLPLCASALATFQIALHTGQPILTKLLASCVGNLW